MAEAKTKTKAAAAVDSITVRFTHERDTKNKVVYSEDIPEADWANNVVGKLYISKASFESMGQPNTITVVISK